MHVFLESSPLRSNADAYRLKMSDYGGSAAQIKHGRIQLVFNYVLKAAVIWTSSTVYCF